MVENSETTSKLVALAYNEDDEDKYWRIIAKLHKRGSSHEFEAAQKLVKSEDSTEREIGADILGQLGWSTKAYQYESVSILIKRLSDSNDDVIASAAFSLGHRNDHRAAPYLIKLIEHQNPRVRFGVVSGLSGLEDKFSIDALIKLSRDKDFDVRNWATFGLGSLCEIDTKELKKALHDRLHDIEYEIRGEALIGLANRKDNSILNNLINELEGEFNGNWAIEAAKLLAMPQCCKVLLKLKDRLDPEDKEYFLGDVNDAISVCCQSKT